MIPELLRVSPTNRVAKSKSWPSPPKPCRKVGILAASPARVISPARAATPFFTYNLTVFSESPNSPAIYGRDQHPHPTLRSALRP